MAFSGHSQIIYNAAFNGCIAGQLAAAGLPVLAPAAVPTPTNTVYVAMVAVATAYATALDAVIPADGTNFATGGATIPPTTAGITAHQDAQVPLVQALSLGYWSSRAGAQLAADAGATSTDYTALAAAIYVLYQAATTGYGNAPGGTSLS